MSFYSAVKRWLDQQQQSLAAVPLPATTLKSETEMRGDAEAILRAAISGVDPERLVVQAMRSRVGSIPLEGRVWVAGFGKAAATMARGLHTVLGGRISRGILVVPPRTQCYVSPQFQVVYGGHPLPDPSSVAASRAIRQMAREAGPADTLICLISGGGSSLLTLPPDDLPVADVERVTSLLVRSGAPIEEINCVRKHLDELKGGRLAREAAPARVLALVLSDVPGDPLEVVASGPVSPDATRFADAVAVLKNRDLWTEVPLAARGYLDRGVCGELPDSPRRDDPVFLRTTNVLIGNGPTAASAACAEAERRGYESQLLTATLTGEARDAGRFLAETAQTLKRSRGRDGAPICVVTTGQTTVTLAGEGRGGRNQELALGAALGLARIPSVLVASMGSDGADGTSGAAGAIVTGSTLERAERFGLDAEAALRRNDAYSFFDALDDLIVSGPTGTNVADLQIVLVA